MVFASIFRDAVDTLDRFFYQIDKLETLLDVPVYLVVAEGDSTDRTHSLLYQRMRRSDTLLKVDHGGPKFGSIDHPQRWAQIAYVCNHVMDALPENKPVIYCEQDLQWEPDVMLRLLQDLGTCAAVAPMSMHKGGFYDIWGHRGLDGTRFNAVPPYHPSLETDEPLVEISSAGSCVVMRHDVARTARFGVNDCIVGLGRNIRRHHQLWLDKRVSVYHP